PRHSSARRPRRHRRHPARVLVAPRARRAHLRRPRRGPPRVRRAPRVEARGPGAAVTSEQRAGELDDVRLAEALAPLVGGDVTFDKVGGGASNVTRLVRGAERTIIVRMPPPGASQLKAGAHDVIREARLIERIKGVYPLVPR